MYIALFLLQQAGGGGEAAGPAGQATASPWSTLILFGTIIIVFYFFMIRPQQKRQKEEAKFRESLSKGDKVVTLGGIVGKVASVEDDHVLLDVDSNTKLRLLKSAISRENTGSSDGKK